MKHLAVALIVVALLAGDFGADLWLHHADNQGWDQVAGVGIVFALVWFIGHWSDDD